MTAAWVPEEFDGALAMLAKMRGESKSQVIRRALTREALDAAQDPKEEDRADRD